MPEGNWITATSRTTYILSHKVKEPEMLYFFPNAQYEITYNDPQGRFSQSQLAVLLTMPTDAQLQKLASIKGLLAPEGCKTVLSELLTYDDFLL